MHRFAVVIDDIKHGPCFMPWPDDGMPALFESWEDAMAAAIDAQAQKVGPPMIPLDARINVIRLQDG